MSYGDSAGSSGRCQESVFLRSGRCYELMVPRHSYVKAITPSVSEFGDSALKEVIKVKPGNKDGILILQD